MDSSSALSDSSSRTAQNKIAKGGEKFEGFDILRVIFAIAIVAYKTKIFNIPEILIPNDFVKTLSGYILSGMFGALAVPVFLQMSLFLFYYKSEKTGFSYFMRKRLPRLIYLYLFWVGSTTVFDILVVGKPEVLQGATSSLKYFLEFIVSGNSTPYFFFFSLIFITVIAEISILLFGKLKNSSAKITVSYSLLFISCLLILVFSTLQPIINYTGVQSSFLNSINNIAGWDYTPTNFLPYAFTTAITAQEYSQGKLEKLTKSLKRKLYGLLALAILFFSLEWTLTSHRLLIQVDQAPLDHYLRLSLVFGSWLLLYLALLSKQKFSAGIKLLSACSLGIYGFHVFFIKKPILLGSIPGLGGIFQAAPVLQILVDFLITLGGSIVLTLLFKKIKILRNFV